MSTNKTTGIMQLAEQALAEVKTISCEEAVARKDSGDLIFVDVRDIREVEKKRYHCRIASRPTRHDRIFGSILLVHITGKSTARKTRPTCCSVTATPVRRYRRKRLKTLALTTWRSLTAACRRGVKRAGQRLKKSANKRYETPYNLNRT